MTHLPYILASYGLAALIALALSIGAALRLKQARMRLAVLERSSDRTTGATPSL
nr:heme exporter protein CcmD [uncultured Acetobacter sp.]